MTDSPMTRFSPTDTDAGATTILGIARTEVGHSPQLEVAAQQLACRWGEDRALSAAAVGRLAALVVAAVRHGLRFDPRGVTIRLRWLDPDRVHLEVRWHGCSGTAPSPVASGGIESTAATLDAYAEEWGFGISKSGPTQWMVIDTR